MEKDAFARSSAARAWQAAREANQMIEYLMARLDRIEHTPPERRLQRCVWCGAWSNAPACREHFDLLTTAELLEQQLSEDVA